MIITLLICYPKCSTCKKAQKLLDEMNISYTYRDIKEDNPKVNELRVWYKMSGQELRKFFNTSGLKYKELNLKEKLKTMNDDEMINLLANDGMLVKRPLLICNYKVIIDFKKEEYLTIACE